MIVIKLLSGAAMQLAARLPLEAWQILLQPRDPPQPPLTLQLLLQGLAHDLDGLPDR